MKLIYSTGFLIFLLLFSQGCEDIVGGDINRDPNNPTAVPVSAQLPAFQIALADEYGGLFSRFNGLLVQQVEGVARQWSSLNSYTGLTPNRYDASWNNIYENVLNELHVARATSIAQGFNHFEGIIDIMEAFTMMMATDVWDDIPYSEAVQGVGNINPKFDAQSKIYTAINMLLDNGISKLSGAAGGVAPGSKDVYYGGDVENWIRAAHAIKARGMLHNKNYSGAMSEAMSSFGGAAENLGYQYPDANSGGPWYRFNDGRTGDIEFHPTMKKIMTDLNDMDRLSVIDVIFVTDASYTASHPFIRPDYFQELVTYREMQFIIAESDVRNGGTQLGYDAYLAGIKASFEKFGLGDAEYDAYTAQTEINPGLGSLTLEHVMIQKYIGLYLQPEVYNDYRRTNIPELDPVSGPNVPVRWAIPQTEVLFNSNAPAAGSINVFTDRVGWNR
ncbi:MAG: SusD/RagB family nutrient-binding outer membrane lipoprotein [Saprospiraceae bacterium]